MVDRLDELVVQQPILKKAPLRAVIVQMRFQEVLGLSPEDVRPIQKALAEEYPLVDREDEMELQLGPDGLKPTGNQRRTFRFRDPEHAWTVTLTPISLSLETSAYSDFKDFARRWMGVAEPAVKALDIPMQERLGLRYINQLDASAKATPEDLRALVQPELVSLCGANERTSTLLQSLQEARFAQDDGTITIRHGLVTPEDSGETTYVLDFDYYVQERVKMDLDDQLTTLIEFNHGIYELFQWAVADSTFETFEPAEKEKTNA